MADTSITVEVRVRNLWALQTAFLLALLFPRLAEWQPTHAALQWLAHRFQPETRLPGRQWQPDRTEWEIRFPTVD